MKSILWILMITLTSFVSAQEAIKTGAEQTDLYLSKIQNKRIAILANPTTIIGDKHLVDSLMNLGVEIKKVFGPEHGFRGNASNGTVVSDETDAATGIKIISLYGNKRKPSEEDLADVDLVIFDIQDVGCRFYTYINVLRDLMESCAEHGKPLMILDRPNPNGYLVDGPILDMKHKSGIGQFPIPIAHGMTVGEFARMVNGEGWMSNGLKCQLEVVPVKNYKHSMKYVLPVSPSPNLNTAQSIFLYPSTCLFEGTYLNHGRGTYFPFTVLGSPNLKGKYEFTFTPHSIQGMSESPLFMDEVCYGLDLRQVDVDSLMATGKINLSWMMDLYKNSPNKAQFFDRSLSRQIGSIEFLSGVSDFRKQIESGASEEEIRASWEPGLSRYKETRKKYLLYP